MTTIENRPSRLRLRRGHPLTITPEPDGSPMDQLPEAIRTLIRSRAIIEDVTKYINFAESTKDQENPLYRLLGPGRVTSSQNSMTTFAERKELQTPVSEIVYELSGRRNTNLSPMVHLQVRKDAQTDQLTFASRITTFDPMPHPSEWNLGEPSEEVKALAKEVFPTIPL